VVFQRLNSAHWEGVLRGLVAEHAAETHSRFAADLLRDWERVRGAFWQICPKEMLSRLPQPLDAVEEQADPAMAKS
jgi:glutamate synthase (NADPH/NADH) large chain